MLGEAFGIFHFSDKALKGARKRRGKPRPAQQTLRRCSEVRHPKNAIKEQEKAARSKTRASKQAVLR